MRITAVCLLLGLTTACTNAFTNPIPTDRFYFPMGVAHVRLPGTDAGVLLVASANADQRYSSGAVTAVALDAVALPPLGQVPVGPPLAVTDLATPTAVTINRFAGELAVLGLGGGRSRAFVPSRSDGSKLQAIDAAWVNGRVALTCFPPAPVGQETDCSANAPSLSPPALESSVDGVPRALYPYGVAVSARACSADADCGGGRACVDKTCQSASGDAFGDVYVTHLTQVDSPNGSLTNYRAYLMRLDSDALTVDASNFTNIGAGAASSVAVGRHWTYASGRSITTPASSAEGYGSLLRLVDRTGVVMTAALESFFTAYEARGVAVGTGERRLYLIGRRPDVLLVLELSNPESATPSVRLVGSFDLPYAPQQLIVIPRPGRGDLVAVSCSGTYSGVVDGVVALYDEDVGGLVARVPGVGLEPFGLTADVRGGGARLFVSNYGDGRVAVIDVPKLEQPQAARLVAHLGASQLCLTTPGQTAGCGVAP